MLLLCMVKLSVWLQSRKRVGQITLPPEGEAEASFPGICVAVNFRLYHEMIDSFEFVVGRDNCWPWSDNELSSEKRPGLPPNLEPLGNRLSLSQM